MGRHGHRIAVHAVGAHAHDAAQAAGTEFQVFVESILVSGRVAVGPLRRIERKQTDQLALVLVSDMVDDLRLAERRLPGETEEVGAALPSFRVGDVLPDVRHRIVQVVLGGRRKLKRKTAPAGIFRLVLRALLVEEQLVAQGNLVEIAALPLDFQRFAIGKVGAVHAVTEVPDGEAAFEVDVGLGPVVFPVFLLRHVLAPEFGAQPDGQQGDQVVRRGGAGHPAGGAIEQETVGQRDDMAEEQGHFHVTVSGEGLAFQRHLEIETAQRAAAYVPDRFVLLAVEDEDLLFNVTSAPCDGNVQFIRPRNEDGAGFAETGGVVFLPFRALRVQQFFHVELPLVMEGEGLEENDGEIQLGLGYEILQTANDVEAVYNGQPHGIQVNVIGVGTSEGSTIPMGNGQSMTNEEGEVIVTKLDEEKAEQIAKAGKGTYIQGNATDAAEVLEETLAKLASTNLSQESFSKNDEQFPVFAWIALILLIANVILLNNKNPWLAKQDLFKFKAKNDEK